MLEGNTIYWVAAGIVALFIINFTIQTIKLRRSKLGKVMSVSNEVRFNDKFVRKFGYKALKQRFKTEAWLQHKNDIDFLDEDLLALLAKTYEDIIRINEKIDFSVGQINQSYLDSINVDPLKEPLKQLRGTLDNWVKRNYLSGEYAPKRNRWLGW